MMKITITVEYDSTKDEILDLLEDAAENGNITEAFNVSVDEVPEPFYSDRDAEAITDFTSCMGEMYREG